MVLTTPRMLSETEQPLSSTVFKIFFKKNHFSHLTLFWTLLGYLLFDTDVQIKKVLDSCFSTFSPPRLCRSPPPSSLCQAKGGFKTFIDCETLRIWPVPAVISCLREEISHHPLPTPQKPTTYAWFGLNGPTVLLGSDPPGSCVCVLLLLLLLTTVDRCSRFFLLFISADTETSVPLGSAAQLRGFSLLLPADRAPVSPPRGLRDDLERLTHTHTHHPACYLAMVFVASPA